jgi:hypothetical protein
MRKIDQIFSEDKGLKEQVGCRVESSIKKILEEIAKKEFRTVANVTEKLICERLRDLGFLDKDFQQIEPKSSKK